MSLIYKATCLINNKVYIGKTSNTLQKRMNEHKSAIGHYKRTRNIKFYNALDKHGFNNFKWEIIEDDVLNEVLNDREIYWIEFYNSKKLGYNSTIGRDGMSCGEDHPNFGMHHTEETKVKMRNSHHHLKGADHPSFGRKASQEERNKMSLDRKERGVFVKENNPSFGKHGKDNPNGDKKIYMFHHNKFGYEKCTRHELQVKYELGSGNLSSLINKKLKHHKGWTVVEVLC